MAEFLEERLPIGVRMGASYADEYNVEITQTASDSEYRKLVHAYPRRVYSIMYTQVTSDLWSQILALYHRAYGMYAGFRVKAWDDYTTNSRIVAPTATDQTLGVITAGSVYQLQLTYGAGATPISIGLPVRKIYKPVASTTLVAIGSIAQVGTWAVSTTTGQVTFNANITGTITGITKATSAVVTLGAHSITTAHNVHFSGVLGMTEINGLRGNVTAYDATTITVNINSTGFSTWSAGGTQRVNTRPQTGETVYGGCEFDIPCRFNSRIDVNAISKNARESGQIEIIELLNPA